MLDPAGPRADVVADFWWFMLALASAVLVVVLALLMYALFRKRDDADASPSPPGGLRFVTIGGIAIPAIILLVLFAASLPVMSALQSPDEPAAVEIEVVGHQWWWEVRYPGQDVVTANEIHIPAGEPVRIRMTAEGVIHSFWVPELAGKLDMIPGDVNEFWIEADEPGVYVGECAEFCGVQHAKMAFRVIAEPPDTFSTWLDAMREPAAEPDTPLIERGQEVFLSSACITCHRVGGTQATGALGPDLTHIASRRTLAAGTLQNTPANLAAWIVDPQAIKPGALMPPSDLTGEELLALLAYLESLE